MFISEATKQQLAVKAQEQSRHCAPVFLLASSESGASDILFSATMALVETPQRQLFITSAHVWEKYVNLRSAHPDAVFAAYFGADCGVLALSELEYLDGSASIDLAVLHAPRAGRLRFRDKAFFRIPEWPISKAVVGESAMVVGYPCANRALLPQGIDLGYSHFGFAVSSVSERHFVLAHERCDRVWVARDAGDPDILAIGGMSGSPAFVSREEVTHLVGFLYEGNTSHDSIFLAHASFINQDGTLDHHSIPPDSRRLNG